MLKRDRLALEAARNVHAVAHQLIDYLVRCDRDEIKPISGCWLDLLKALESASSERSLLEDIGKSGWSALFWQRHGYKGRWSHEGDLLITLKDSKLFCLKDKNQVLEIIDLIREGFSLDDAVNNLYLKSKL